MKYTISYKGKVLVTEHHKDLTDDKFCELRKAYYEKPNIEDVKNQMLSIWAGGTKNNLITAYYVKDLMVKTHIYYDKWTVEDVFEYKPLLEWAWGKIHKNRKLFPESNSDITNLEKVLQLGGKGVATKPTNFPIKTVDYVLQNYNINNNWYDFSCGWGARLTGALKHRVNYFGTDPNYVLVERLQSLAQTYKETTFSGGAVDIRAHGSEQFVPEWENRMGLAFSSPPYFLLEDYKVGNQSYKPGMLYSDWISSYLEPTLHNIHRYLIDTGILIVNINDFDVYNLTEDTVRTAERCGFEFVDKITLENISRVNGTMSDDGRANLNDNNETMFVFRKAGSEVDVSRRNTQALFESRLW